MHISGRCDYACHAMLELALHVDAGMPLAAQQIASARHIPEKYLTHILLQLKRAQLVRSQRGAQGGYVLQEAPEQISLLDIIEAIEGPLLLPVKQGETANTELSPFWETMSAEIGAVLARITLRDMLERTRKDNMFHI